MKLLTKAWYQTMQDSGMGVMLQVDERAAECSEELFQAVWEEKLAEDLELRREMCAEFEEVFDEAQERQSFAEQHRWEMEYYRTRMPESILNQVADLRVLALGYCTEAVFRALKEYRAWCETWTEKTMDEAWKMRCSQGLESAFTGEHSLHDSVVLSLQREGEDLRMEFEREDPMERLRDIRENDPELLEEMGEEPFLFPEIRAICFRDAEILKQEKSVEKAFWLYDEIWRTEEGGFEIHALLWKDNGVFELTIRCRDTELLWTVPQADVP